MTTLIITGRDDVHADAVIPLLEDADSTRPIIRLNTEDLATNTQFTMTSGAWDGDFTFADAGRSLRLSDVRSVWYRKPSPVRAPLEISSQPAAAFTISEYGEWLRSLYDLLTDRFWVSGYWNIRRAGQKLANLRLAASLGLTTPDTLVTNRVGEALAFAERCNWKVLVKPFALESFKLDQTDSVSWDVFASTFNREVFTAMGDAIRFAPTMLQEYIPKDIELRITVVGRKVFCTAIESQAHPLAVEDWRAVDVESLAHHAHPLPAELETKLLAFNHAYGLEFSTFDIIIDTAGRYVWLECNPNGQWRWIETLTGQPIAAAIADLLHNPSTRALRP